MRLYELIVYKLPLISNIPVFHPKRHLFPYFFQRKTDLQVKICMI
ncbi:hypothetical protein HMPREF3293_00286 [Christensenella minuta]|uniref:Uncharacterized protein n=1 Tax=Christensenella minuta TaxID=626937 RepID=A0A136Q8A4_9FIRM|nr:hypothetical protein HMPREF3293_00286 [Christensenella minuta]